MKIIYVAGPYRAEGHSAVLDNILKAREVARILWRKGWAVICPHANSILMDGPDISPQTFIDGDLEIILRCDAMCMLPGWEKSAGANQEYALAVELGIPVYSGIDVVPNA